MGLTRRGVAVAAYAACVGLTIALAGCTGATSGTSGSSSAGGGATAGKVTVVEKDFKFDPAQITAAVGDQVVFQNQDSAPHHVVVGTTDLGIQQPGQSVTWKADKNGTLAVKCLIHPTMVGQVTVGAGGGGSQPAPPAGGTGSGSPAAPSGSGY